MANVELTVTETVIELTVQESVTSIETNGLFYSKDGGGSGAVSSVNDKTGAVVLNAADVGATTQAYVDTQDGLLQDQIDSKADAISVDQVLSTKADLVGGLIPASQLPSYADDVLSFVDLASFPVTGEEAKIYIAEDVNKTYRWSGSSYVEIRDLS